MIRLEGNTLVVAGPLKLEGSLLAPGDKSLSHRALLCAALAHGESIIENLAPGDDVTATADALRLLGVELDGNRVSGSGRDGLREAADVVDCRNSGTSMRLLAGFSSALPFTTVLNGDESLRSRPMLRVVTPLREMGAEIVGRCDGDRAPLAIRGGHLRGLHHKANVASAQLKSSLLYAGLSASGPVSVELPAGSRDHTERMFRALGVDVEESGAGGRSLVTVRAGEPRPLGSYRVPGDMSSSAFILSAAALLPGSDVTVDEVNVNPTRAAVLEVLAEMGAQVEIRSEREVLGEPVASVRVCSTGSLTAVRVDGTLVPRLGDELPVLAVLMAAAEGRSVVHGAAELRVKESDRIATIVAGLRAMGGEVTEAPDGFAVEGPQLLHAAVVESAGDHRVAMAFAVAGLALRGETIVREADCIATSYPAFADDLLRLVTP